MRIKEVKTIKKSDVQLRNARDNAEIAITIAKHCKPNVSTSWYIRQAMRSIAVTLDKHHKSDTKKFSVARKQQIEQARKQGVKPPPGVGDHAIPLSLFSAKVMSVIKDMTVQQLLDMAETYRHIVEITAEENRKLEQAGLQKKMPPGWDGVDNYARYHAVGIEIEK